MSDRVSADIHDLAINEEDCTHDPIFCGPHRCQRLLSMATKTLGGGWIDCGSSRYTHACGSIVKKDGKSWVTIGRSGSHLGRFQTRAGAFDHLRTNDPDFWAFDMQTSYAWGAMGGVLIDTGINAGRDAMTVRTCERLELPKFLATNFARFAFGIAQCASCGRLMEGMDFKELPYFGCNRTAYDQGDDPDGLGWHFLVCHCGFPIWVMEGISELEARLRKAQKNLDRSRMVRAAEGRYSSADLEAIHRRQGGKCAYCSTPIATPTEWSIDHVVPIAEGGTNWPENLCLACRPCNSLKRDMSAEEFMRLVATKKK